MRSRFLQFMLSSLNSQQLFTDTGMLMFLHTLTLAVTAALAAPTALESGTQLTFRGKIEADKGDPVITRKTFELNCLLVDVTSESATVYWTLSEQGRGNWLWTDHFGRVQVRGSSGAAPAQWPALLYQRDAGKSIVPVVLPLLFLKRTLERDTNWEEGKLNFKVTGSQRVASHNSWIVRAENRYGHKRTVWLDKASALVARVVETVFIGQGEQFELQYELAQKKMLSATELSATTGGFETLFQLRQQLRRQPRDPRMVWSAEQLGILRKQLPTLAKPISDAPALATVFKEAERDTKIQKGRAGAIGALQAKTMGKPLESFPLVDSRGRAFDQQAWKNRVTVLHFWRYRDKPLEEPYGQIAYLDFLYRKHKGKGIGVYGINVNQRLQTTSSRRPAILSAKKLTSFMNLSYPVLHDTEGVLKKLGDPRQSGAKLPLVIVLDQTGKVVHYHVGHYPVDRLLGLKQLNDLVVKTLKTAK